MTGIPVQRDAHRLAMAQLVGMLHVSGTTAEEWLETRQIVGERDDEGRWSVPAWQFPQGRVVPPLAALLPLVPEGLSLIAVERFFTAPCADLVIEGEPVTPLDWLVMGGDSAQVAPLLPFLGLVP